jgi:hypothetical protein
MDKQTGGETIMANKEMRSAVCALGNRLAAKASGFTRPEAFSKAWAIVKAGSLTLPVRGVSFGGRQVALRRLAAYKPSMARVYLVPEPENPADRDAVAVMVGVQWGRGLYRLGYVPAGETATALAMKARPRIQILPGDIMGARITLGVGGGGLCAK